MGCLKFFVFAIALVFAVVFIPFTLPLLIVVVLCYIPWCIFRSVTRDSSE